MTCFDCNGEEIFLGLLGDGGMRYLSRREAAADALERGIEIEQGGAIFEPLEKTLFK